MANRDKQREVFVELVNLQLKPHNTKYSDVVSDPDWYMKYPTTREKENEFILRGVELLKNKLKMTKAIAEKEMMWFVLQWGLTTNGDDSLSEMPTKEKVERKTTTKKNTRKNSIRKSK